ncbi:hypothetical protein [Nonomuraea guangzhouensis]|uniref:Uncharacterized protein n=1 Tax=Nonomuraea guangzhouensis TaxID=1291555 RepID=A0ABW4GNA9_9ACTN|nr:hypothetical protein [Nonomuraea guangzhouensis]
MSAREAVEEALATCDPAKAAEIGTWLMSLTVLQSEGTIDRGLLIDGCLRRFLRGGSAGDLRFFARLHELLEPTYAEVASRAHDYLRLLPAAPGAVAELALRTCAGSTRSTPPTWRRPSKRCCSGPSASWCPSG